MMPSENNRVKEQLEEMTSQQALDTVDSVCRNFKGTRNEHVLLLESIKVLKGLCHTSTSED